MAELLIALAILGVIATFTIPKILDSGSDSKWNAIGLEAAATISGAYQQYKLSNSISASTGPADLTPYLNYVKIDSVTTIDDVQTSTSILCGAVYTCLVLHNGGYLFYRPTNNFNATAATNAMFWGLDPDGKYSGSTTGPGKTIIFWLYTNGRLRTYGTLEPNTYFDGGGPYVPVPSLDPPWFSWSN